MDAYTTAKLPSEAGVSVYASGVLPPIPSWRAYTWGALAVLTCPCHLPLLAAVLAGTGVGAFVGDHWGVAALALTGLFLLSMTRLLRVFGRRQ
jgi:mercuric ion transport protein